MSDGLDIRLTGERDLIAAFRDLKPYLTKNVLRKALRAGANILLEAIQARTPRRTGKLFSNISVRVRATRKTLRARVTVNKRGKEGDPQNAFYYRFLEKGFTTKGGEKRLFPFIEPAVTAAQQQAAQQVIDSVEEAIKRAEKKAQRAARRAGGGR